MRNTPLVWLTYDGDGGTVAYEGDYDAPTLPFAVEHCEGRRFEMDGIEFVIRGDLGGHAIYSRVDADSPTLYAMTWHTMSLHHVDDIVDFC